VGTEADPGDITRLLGLASSGDDEARSELIDLLYHELRRLAGNQMRGLQGGTLHPTALVHEAWLRLESAGDAGFENRGHFLGVAARAMRSVVIDHVRAKRAVKRGGGDTPSRLDEVVAHLEAEDTDLLDLHHALEELEHDDPELGRVVELRFFGGLTHDDVAAALGCSTSTVERAWRVARARLHKRLVGKPEP